MPNKIACLLIPAFLAFGACQSGEIQENNPPVPGFNIEASDHQAIIIADEVMEAMGGRKNWDATRYLVWNFFGRRKLWWDRQSGNVRIESYPDSTTYLLNMENMTGRVLKNGKQVIVNDSLKLFLSQAKSIWINDSYWLIMPFKLKDDGVTLKHIGEGKTENGYPSEILELTFKGVGDTPNNKYLVYVDKETKLVSQWSYFRTADQTEPDFTTPWTDYKKYGKILLSGSRGERQITEIGAPENLPASTFSEF